MIIIMIFHSKANKRTAKVAHILIAVLVINILVHRVKAENFPMLKIRQFFVPSLLAMHKLYQNLIWRRD